MRLEGRLELLKQKVQEEDFLNARGLGNEIPFWIFDYPPEKELLVRETIDKITTTLKKRSVNVLVIDLYEICLELLEDKISAEKIFEFENKKGSDELLNKLKMMFKPETVKKVIQKRIESGGNIQLMFLTGVGKAWPLIRSHSILNNLQPLMEIAKYLTRREDADKLIIEIRKKTNTEIISSVRSILRDVFDKTDIPEKENELYNFTHKIITDKLLDVKEISGKYAEEKRYPGKEDIEKYAAFLNRVQEVTDPSAFLKTMADEKNELVGLRQKVEPVMAFFDGPQVGIFRRISKKIENFRRNAQFLSDEARSNVDEIEGILTCAEPYSKIKLLPQLESGIEVSLQNSLSVLKQDVQTRLKTVKGEIEKELKNHKVLTDKFKQSVFENFNDVEKNIVGSDDCAFVKLQLEEIVNLQRDAYERIESNVQKHRESEGGYKPEAGAKIIQDTSLFRTKKIIENEKDLDEYISNLRAALKEILKNNKIRVL